MIVPHVPVSTTNDPNTTQLEDVADIATPESTDTLPDVVVIPP